MRDIVNCGCPGACNCWTFGTEMTEVEVYLHFNGRNLLKRKVLTEFLDSRRYWKEYIAAQIGLNFDNCLILIDNKQVNLLLSRTKHVSEKKALFIK